MCGCLDVEGLEGFSDDVKQALKAACESPDEGSGEPDETTEESETPDAPDQPDTPDGEGAAPGPGNSSEPDPFSPTLPEPETGVETVVEYTGVFSVVETVAGSGFAGSSNGSPGTKAEFNTIRGLGTAHDFSCDADIPIVVADQNNHMVRQMESVEPYGVKSLAGSGLGGFNNTCNAPKKAQFSSPHAVTWCPVDGTTYVADTTNGCVRAILPNGCITTVKGPCITPAAKDANPNATTPFSKPRGIAINAACDTIWVADENNKRIAQVDIASGEIIDLVGGPNATDTMIAKPRGLDIVPDESYLVVSDDGKNAVFKVSLPDGNVSLISGKQWPQDGTVSATHIDGKPGIARFYRPRNLCTDGKTAYVMDYANNAVRAVDLKSGYTTTVFGKGADPFALEGQSAKCLPNGDCTETDGPVQTATIDNPTACVVKVGCMNGQEGMADVTLFVASDFGHTIRRVV